MNFVHASVLLTVALFAKSYKEAQSYVGPMMILVVIPAVIGMLPGFELTWRAALVPIVGTSLASKEVLAGAFPWGLLALIFLSSTLYAGIALWVATRMFQRENVLFRS